MAFFIGLVKIDFCLWNVVFSSFIICFCRLLPVGKSREQLRKTLVKWRAIFSDWHAHTSDQTHTLSWNKILFSTLHENSVFSASYWSGHLAQPWLLAISHHHLRIRVDSSTTVWLTTNWQIITLCKKGLEHMNWIGYTVDVSKFATLAIYLERGHELLVARERQIGEPWPTETIKTN